MVQERPPPIVVQQRPPAVVVQQTPPPVVVQEKVVIKESVSVYYSVILSEGKFTIICILLVPI